MSYDIGTAKGTIDIDASGAVAGAATASTAVNSIRRGTIATSTALMTAGRHLMILGGLAVAGFGLAVNAAMNFEKEMSAFKAVSSANERQMDRIREAALRLGRDTVFSAGEAAQAITELSKAGISTEDILNGAADAAVNLAAAGGIDIPTAATVAANAMNTFGIAAEDLEGVADSFAGTANRTATDVTELAEAMRYTGASAALLNLPLGDVNVALGILANRGLRGSVAGTNLNRMLINLNPASDKAAEAMRNLGIITEDGSNQFFTAEGKAKSLAEIAQVLQDSLEGLSDQQRIQALETIFGSRALQAATALSEAGAQGFNRLKRSIGDVTAEETAEEKMNNLAGSIEFLRGSWETFLINAGEGAQGPLKDIVDRFAGWVNVLAELNPEILQWGMIVLGALGSVLLLLGAITYITGAIMKFKVAMEVLKVGPLLTNPITLTILAIAALVAAFIWAYNNVDWFREGVNNFLEDIRPTLESIRDWVINAFHVFMDEVLPMLIQWGKNFLNFMDGLINNVMSWGDEIRTAIMAAVNVIVTVWDWLWSKIGPVVEAIGELFAVLGPKIISVFKAIMPILKGIFDAVKNIISTAVGVIKRVWNLFGDNIVETIRIAFTFIRNTIKSAMQIIKGIINVVTGILSGDWSKAWEGIKSIFAGVWNAILNIFATIWGVLRNAFFMALDTIRLAWHEAWNVIKSVFSAAWEVIRGIALAAWNAFQGLWHGFLDFLRSAWDAAWRNVSNFLRSVWQSIRQTLTNGINSAIQFLGGLPNRAYQAISALAGRMLDRGREAMRSLWTGLQNMWENARNWLSSLPDRIINIIGDLGDLLLDIGRDIIDGLIDGLQAGMGPLGDVLGGIGGFISDHKGPPEYDAVLLVPNGQLIMQSLMDGMASMMPELNRMVGKIAPTIANDFLPSPSGLHRSMGGSTSTTHNDNSEATYKVEAHTDADPEEIMDSLMWMSAVKA